MLSHLLQKNWSSPALAMHVQKHSGQEAESLQLEHWVAAKFTKMSTIAQILTLIIQRPLQFELSRSFY